MQGYSSKLESQLLIGFNLIWIQAMLNMYSLVYIFHDAVDTCGTLFTCRTEQAN